MGSLLILWTGEARPRCAELPEAAVFTAEEAEGNGVPQAAGMAKRSLRSFACEWLRRSDEVWKPWIKTNCDEGYYQPSGSFKCVMCPAGSYCSDVINDGQPGHA